MISGFNLINNFVSLNIEIKSRSGDIPLYIVIGYIFTASLSSILGIVSEGLHVAVTSKKSDIYSSCPSNSLSRDSATVVTLSSLGLISKFLGKLVCIKF